VVEQLRQLFLPHPDVFQGTLPQAVARRPIPRCFAIFSEGQKAHGLKEAARPEPDFDSGFRHEKLGKPGDKAAPFHQAVAQWPNFNTKI
jgi:hypothetical protein